MPSAAGTSDGDVEPGTLSAGCGAGTNSADLINCASALRAEGAAGRGQRLYRSTCSAALVSAAGSTTSSAAQQSRRARRERRESRENESKHIRQPFARRKAAARHPCSRRYASGELCQTAGGDEGRNVWGT